MLAQMHTELVARLEQLLPDAVRVLTSDDLGDLTEDRMPTPSVHLIYRGEQVLETRPDGYSARTASSWLVVAVVANQRRGSSNEAEASATELQDRIRPGLMGWRPQCANGPLMLATPPAPAMTSACFYLPTVFTVETIVHANH